jgi:hypothetical protein
LKEAGIKKNKDLIIIERIATLSQYIYFEIFGYEVKYTLLRKYYSLVSLPSYLRDLRPDRERGFPLPKDKVPNLSREGLREIDKFQYFGC